METIKEAGNVDCSRRYIDNCLTFSRLKKGTAPKKQPKGPQLIQGTNYIFTNSRVFCMLLNVFLYLLNYQVLSVRMNILKQAFVKLPKIEVNMLYKFYCTGVC